MLRIFIFASVWIGSVASGVAMAQSPAGGVKFLSLGGASRHVLEDASLYVWGGVAGPLAWDCENLQHSGVCNNCPRITTGQDLPETLEPCNEKRVHAGTRLSVRLSGIRGAPQIKSTTESGAVKGVLESTGSGEHVYTVSWGELCDENPLRLDCSHSFKLGGALNPEDSWLTLYVRSHRPINPSATTNPEGCAGSVAGVCAFQILRGDRRLFMADFQFVDVRHEAEDAVLKALDFIKIRAFYEPWQEGSSLADMVEQVGYHSPFADFTILDKNTVEGLVEGLTNDQNYVFKLALVDAANNVAYLTHGDTVLEACSGSGGAPPDPVTIQELLQQGSSQPAACSYVAQPSKITGFLSKKTNCFVATAVTGGGDSLEVEILRNWRDKVLLDFKWGRAFVRFYYKHGPAWADKIQKHSWSKKLMHLALMPVVAWAWVQLNTPTWVWGVLIWLGLLYGVLVFFKRLWLWGFVLLCALGVVSACSMPTAKAAETGARKWIEHPEAKRGLFKITSQGEYLYKTPESASRHGASFRLGWHGFGNLQNSQGLAFRDVYRKAKNWPTFFVDYEWRLWRSAVGDFLLTFGSGFFLAADKGFFASDVARGIVDGSARSQKEKVYFMLLPNSVGALYRLRFGKNPFLVPFAGCGVGVFAALERQGGSAISLKSYHVGAGYVFQYMLGGQISLGHFSRESRIDLDREYGVNALYLTLEFRQYIALKKRLDFSSRMFVGGLAFEF